jgi:hypothetical protein
LQGKGKTTTGSKSKIREEKQVVGRGKGGLERRRNRSNIY